MCISIKENIKHFNCFSVSFHPWFSFGRLFLSEHTWTIFAIGTIRPKLSRKCINCETKARRNSLVLFIVVSCLQHVSFLLFFLPPPPPNGPSLSRSPKTPFISRPQESLPILLPFHLNWFILNKPSFPFRSLHFSCLALCVCVLCNMHYIPISSDSFVEYQSQFKFLKYDVIHFQFFCLIVTIRQWLEWNEYICESNRYGTKKWNIKRQRQKRSQINGCRRYMQRHWLLKQYLHIPIPNRFPQFKVNEFHFIYQTFY